MGTVSEAYERIVGGLDCSETTKSLAREILARIESSHISSCLAEEGSLWASISLFIAAHRNAVDMQGAPMLVQSSQRGDGTSRVARGSDVKLISVLEAAKVGNSRSGGPHIFDSTTKGTLQTSIIDFFAYMKLLSPGDLLTPELALSLKALKEHYVITNVVYNKFSKLWAERLSMLRRASQAEVNILLDTPRDADLPNFVWVLYLTARYYLEPNKQMDMLTSYTLLLAVLELVLKNAYEVPNSDPQLLETLATATGVTTEAILQQRDSVMKLCRDLIKAQHLELRAAAADEPPSEIMSSDDGKTSKEVAFEALIHSAVLKQNILNLNNCYDGLCVDVSRLDERYVLNEQLSNLLDTPCLAGKDKKQPRPPEGAFRQLSSDYNQHFYPTTPTKSKQVPPQNGVDCTPISSSQSDIKWMCSLDNLNQAPGRALLAAMEVCGGSPQQAFARRIEDVFEEFQKSQFARSLQRHSQDARSSAAASDTVDTEIPNDTEEETVGLGLGKGFGLEKGRIVALYYAILEELIQSETRRLRSDNHNVLLQNDKFHRSLLACCCEVILKPACVVAFTYPDLLGYLNLQSFEFQSTIEPFVRAAPGLPGGLKRHMNELLEQILLQDAWKDSSPLYSALDKQRDSGIWPLDRILEKPRRAPELLEKKEDKEGEPESKHEAVGGKRVRTLKNFFSRLLAASASRLFTISRELALDDLKVDQIWTLLKYCLFEQHSLFRDRHVDTIVLCSIYATEKATKSSTANGEPSFKRIMGAYKDSGFSSLWLPVVVHVSMGEGQNMRKSNIIDFYNHVFIKSVRSYVLQFQNAPEHARVYHRATGIPHPGGMRSPHRLLKSNLFLAPPGDFKNSTLTPRTRALYAFGESPSKDLQLINRAVNKRPPPLPEIGDSSGSAEEQRRLKIARIKKRFPVVELKCGK